MTDRSGRRRAFGHSWWGQAWVEAIEGRAHLDANRMPRGRTYARWGYVGELDVQPGVVSALVTGSRPTPYRTMVRVRVLTDKKWNRLLDVVASKVAHAAALADGELSSQLVDDADAAGIELLPGEGDITTACTCPDDANPCKHAAAVCYLIADLLDDDPFSLLEIRGRTHGQIGDALRERRRKSASESSRVVRDEGVVATEAFAQFDPLSPLPKVPRSSPKPGPSMTLPPDMPEGVEIDRRDLVFLADDAIRRAWEMSSGLGDSGLGLSVYGDLVARAARMLDDMPAMVALAQRASVSLSQLEDDARALFPEDEEEPDLLD